MARKRFSPEEIIHKLREAEPLSSPRSGFLNQASTTLFARRSLHFLSDAYTWVLSATPAL